MKYLLALLISAYVASPLLAQCENAYFPFQEGVQFEMTNYKSNGKQIGKIANKVLSAEGSKAVVSSKMYDKKGELISDGSYEVICEDGLIKMDMKQFIPNQILESYQEMEVTIEGDFLTIPNQLKVGQSLPDGSGKVIVNMGSSAMSMASTTEMKFTARNVEKKETITTPAGTFETYKITQTTISTVSMMGMNREMTYTSASWVAEGVGSVRSESYDKKGAINSYSTLTAFEK